MHYSLSHIYMQTIIEKHTNIHSYKHTYDLQIYMHGVSYLLRKENNFFCVK